MPPLITWRVVSSPPTRISSDSCSTSSGSSRSPSTSACTSTLMRSSVGCSWRCATACVQNSVYSSIACIAARNCSSVALPLCALTMSSDQRSRSSRSSGATPSMSPISTIGSGAAMSRTKSHSPLLAHLVDDRVALVADVALAVADAAGREAAVHELAALPVLGIVHVDHHRDRARVGADAARVRERRRVLRRAEHRGVAREAPHVVRGVEVHGRVGAHPRVGRVRVAGVEGAVEQVDVGSGVSAMRSVFQVGSGVRIAQHLGERRQAAVLRRDLRGVVGSTGSGHSMPSAGSSGFTAVPAMPGAHS